MPKRRTQDVVHAVMTDHLIQRQPPGRDLLAPLQEDHSPRKEQPLLYFPRSLSTWERGLYLGMAQVQTPGSLRPGLARQGCIQQALQAFRQAVRLKPEDAEAHSNLGMAYSQLGRLEAAEEAFRQVVRLRPASARAYFNLGRTQAQRGHTREAIEALSRSASLSPRNAEIRLHLGLVYLGAGDRASALGQYEILKGLDPERARVLAERMRGKEAISYPR